MKNETLINDLKAIEKSETVSEVLSIYLKLSEVYLYAENHEVALKWIDKLLFNFKNDLHGNMKIEAMLISIILNYELSNEEYIISLIRSYRRKLSAQKKQLKILQEGINLP